jgi:mannosyl-oligosaccharide alpha-1,2-mannosidase
MLVVRRRLFFPLGLGLFILFLFYSSTSSTFRPTKWPPLENFGLSRKPDPKVLDDEDYFWRKVPQHFPVESIRPLPTGKPLDLPKVQADFDKEDEEDRGRRRSRQSAVKGAFKRCWDTYKKYAWLQDEVKPISGGSRNPLGGWGATLVDSLDTLWIMDMKDEFEEAVLATVDIDFAKTSMTEINAFETTIRYLGGFLSAYDLSGDQRLLLKARELGDMLYVAFDTPNRMPIPRWNVQDASQGKQQEAVDRAMLAEMGSLCMEFTRLSLITGNPKWFDATERIMLTMQEQQMKSQLPGLWPLTVYPRDMKFAADNTFGLGAMGDSVYEYLPKMVALVGGLLPHYTEMYKRATETAIKYNIFRPMVPDSADILVAGQVRTFTSGTKIGTLVQHEGQHLACYVGGMFALGGKLLGLHDHVKTARKLVDGCTWTYKNMPLGIMPEAYSMAPCNSKVYCSWDEGRWKRAVMETAGEAPLSDVKRAEQIIAQRRLPEGFTEIADGRYILRSEAIESVFVMYRTTGDNQLMDDAWAMFEAIQGTTLTDMANSAVQDVTVGSPIDVVMTDEMESFWMGETLKYFYLIFSDPNLISLDEFVFNTEAHPFRRLVP